MALKLKYIVIYVPMLVGGLLGYSMGRLGWEAVAGMLAGGAAWLAYEMRQNTRRMRIDMETMQRDLEWLREGWTRSR